MGGGRWKDLLLDKGERKNVPHQIILALDVTALKFNGVFAMEFFYF